MKVMSEIILFILIMLIGVFFGAGSIQYDHNIAVNVVVDRTPAQVKLNIAFATINESFNQYKPELLIVDNVLKQPETILHNIQQNQTFEQQNQTFEQQFLEKNEQNNFQNKQFENQQIVIFYEEEQGEQQNIYDFVQTEQQQDMIKKYNISISDYASNWLGVTPYVSWQDRQYNSLIEGTDCSGFVSLIYGEFGIDVPAASADYQEMSNIEYQDLQPGDIVVYGNGSHVGIYSGDDMIIHCSNEQNGTIESNMWYNQPTGYVHIGGEYNDYQ